MENIYQICNRCQSGQLPNYPLRNKIINVAFLVAIASPLYLVAMAVIAIITDKLAERAVPLDSPYVQQGAIAAIVLAICAAIAYYFYGLPAHLRGWWNRECPYCEQGYILIQRTSNIQAVIYFLDLFIFQQIMIPMYKALSFQFLWQNSQHRRTLLVGIGKFCFYLALFFGAVPFLVYLLGRNRLIALVVAIAVMLYILYFILLGRRSNVDYQKGIIFLILPLYYVCMVELFRWAWFFSSHSTTVIPDQSNFLLMGLENLLRTQLFMDLFEIYDLNITNIDASSFLSYSAIFITRMLIDIALIAMLIQMAIFCYRRAWFYRYTGQKHSQLISGTPLIDLETAVAVGSPKKIHQIHDKVQLVAAVISRVKPYVESVAGVARREEQQAAQDCLRTLQNWEIAGDNQPQPEPTLRMRDRLLAIAFVSAWAFSFILGINMFIKNVTQHEIALLMALAKEPHLQQDAIARQKLYLKAISKDSSHHPALWLSANTYLEMADAKVRLLDLEPALKNVEQCFAQLERLQQLPEFRQHYQQQLPQLKARAYIIRGSTFFLQGNLKLALSELQKRKNTTSRRLLFNIRLLQASRHLFTNQAPEFFHLAKNELGVDRDYYPRVFLQLLESLHRGYHSNWSSMTQQLDHTLSTHKLRSPTLRALFTDYLAQAYMRQGKRCFAVAEKYFAIAHQEQSDNYWIAQGLVNLYCLQNKYKQAQQLLTKLEKLNIALDITHRIYLQQAMVTFMLGKIPQTQDLVAKLLKGYKIRSRFRSAVCDFLSGNITASQLLEISYSWDLNIATAQKCIANWYIAMKAIRDNKLGRAVKSLRQCIFIKQVQLAEYHQAKQELENLQIQCEGKSYQSELFFSRSYFARLNAALQVEIRKIISAESQAISGLQWIMNSDYQQEKRRALEALTQRQLIAPQKFFPFLQQALQEGDADLQLVALKGLATIGKEGHAANELVLAALQHQREDIRLASVEVFSSWQQLGIEALQQALTNDNKYVRRNAAYALAKLGAHAQNALPSLQSALGDQEAIVRDAAFTAIRQIGAPYNQQALVDIVVRSHQDRELHVAAIKELAAKYPLRFRKLRTQIMPFLVDILLHNPDNDNRRWATIRLLSLEAKPEELDYDKVLPELTVRLAESLRSPDPQQRLSAVLALLNTYDHWKQDGDRVVDLFLKYWRNANDNDQEIVATRFLKEITDIDTQLMVLQQALLDRDRRLRAIAATTLIKLSESNFADVASPVMRVLLKIVRYNQAESKAIAQELLTAYMDTYPQIVFPLIFPLLIDADSNVRQMILQVLASEKQQQVFTEKETKVFMRAWKLSLPIQETMSQYALVAQLKLPELFPVYLRLLTKNSDRIRSNAAELLIFYPQKRQEILPVLEEALQRLVNHDKLRERTGQKMSGERMATYRALIATWGVLDGIESLYRLAQKYNLLEKFALEAVIATYKRSPQKISQQQVVKVLFRFMQTKDTPIVVQGLRQLESLTTWDSQTIAKIMALTYSDIAEIRRESLRLLVEMTNLYNLQELKKLLNDPYVKIRLSALRAIVRFGPLSKPILPHVIAKFTDDEQQVRTQTMKALVTIGKPAIPQLLNNLQTADAQIKSYVIKTLGNMRNKLNNAVLARLAGQISAVENQFTALILEVLDKKISVVHRPIILPHLRKLQPRTEKVQVLYWLVMSKLGYEQRAFTELTAILAQTKTLQQFIFQRILTMETAYANQYIKDAIRQRYGKIDIKTAMQALKKVPDGKASLTILREVPNDYNPHISKLATAILAELLPSSDRENSHK